jgi:glycosyltransferase involved in cell wall biosynthesis
VPNPFHLRLILDTLRRERFDVVHVHGLFSVMGLGVLVGAQMLGMPCVLTSHSLLRPGPLAVARGLFATITRHVDVVAGVSRAAARDLARASGRQDVVVLPNGIDPAAWALTPRPDPGGALRIAAVLRLTRKKNAGALIDAMPVVLARAGARQVTLTVVGDGPERARLEHRAARLGLGGFVEFLGMRTRDEVRQVLAAAAVLAVPCRAEAFGLAALEARAAGVPVVAMRGGGVLESVEHGRHGLLADTPAAFADALAVLVTDAARRGALARNARTGLGPFTWDEAVRRHLDAYRLAMARHAPGRARVAA